MNRPQVTHLLDAAGRIVHANAAGHDMLRAGDVLRAGSLVAGLLAVACASAGPVRPAEPEVASAAPERAVESSPRLTIRFAPLLTSGPARLGVEVTARGIAGRRWSFAAAVAVEPVGLQAHDEAGELALVQGREGQAWVVQLGRAPVGALTESR